MPPEPVQPPDPQTLIIPWKNIISSHGYIGLAIAAFAFSYLISLVFNNNTPPQLNDVITGVFILLSMVFFVKAFFIMDRDRKWRAVISDEESNAETPEELAIILTQWWKARRWKMKRRKIGYFPSYEKITSVYRKHNWPTPKFIIDRRYAEKINAIPITPNLLEPEMIKRYQTLSLLLIEITTGLGIVLILSGSWPWHGWKLAVGGLASYFTVQQFIVMIIYLITGRSSSNYGTVGLGIIELNNGQTIRTDECITLIYKKNTMLVRLLASNGKIIDFDFSGPNDSEFVNFWQRWNHPNPRPELL